MGEHKRKVPGGSAPELRLCIDRIVPEGYSPDRARREKEILLGLGIQVIGADYTGRRPQLRMAVAPRKKWLNGSELNCRFLDGSRFQRDCVQTFAKEWERHANIRFNFSDKKNGDIRISFSAGASSWSAVGMDALNPEIYGPDDPTMNLGWLDRQTDELERRRVVLHEFGHALGAVHEHQSPGARLVWNKPEVYRIFSGPPNNWSQAEIDANLIERYSAAQYNWDEFDAQSIMLYQLPAILFENGQATPLNTDLSPGDKAFIAKMYPFIPPD